MFVCVCVWMRGAAPPVRRRRTSSAAGRAAALRASSVACCAKQRGDLFGGDPANQAGGDLGSYLVLLAAHRQHQLGALRRLAEGAAQPVHHLRRPHLPLLVRRP